MSNTASYTGMKSILHLSITPSVCHAFSSYYCELNLSHRLLRTLSWMISHPIFYIGLPSLGHGSKVKHLDISIVIACTHTPLNVTEWVAKCHTPTVSPCLSLCWLHASHWTVFLPWVPHLHATCTFIKMARPVSNNEYILVLHCTWDLHGQSQLTRLFSYLPSLLPVTISGAPPPTPSPPMASIALTIALWPLTE